MRSLVWHRLWGQCRDTRRSASGERPCATTTATAHTDHADTPHEHDQSHPHAHTHTHAVLDHTSCAGEVQNAAEAGSLDWPRLPQRRDRTGPSYTHSRTPACLRLGLSAATGKRRFDFSFSGPFLLPVLLSTTMFRRTLAVLVLLGKAAGPHCDIPRRARRTSTAPYLLSFFFFFFGWQWISKAHTTKSIFNGGNDMMLTGVDRD